MTRAEATAQAWAFLKSTDFAYRIGSLQDLDPERMEHLQTLTDILVNSCRRASSRALYWAIDKAGSIVHAEAVQLEKGADCPW